MELKDDPPDIGFPFREEEEIDNLFEEIDPDTYPRLSPEETAQFIQKCEEEITRIEKEDNEWGQKMYEEMLREQQEVTPQKVYRWAKCAEALSQCLTVARLMGKPPHVIEKMEQHLIELVTKACAYANFSGAN